jgi:phosphoribosyl 1,2-cyclic phosphate phosphodiesterase
VRAARDCAGLLITREHVGEQVGEQPGGQNILIDTAPELRTQLIREGISEVDAVLYTHEHYDHLGGLPHLEFYVRLRSHTPLPVYAGHETLAAIEQRFDFMTDTLDCRLIKAFEPVELDGVRYTPLPATHGEGTFGFLIETAASRSAYFPDTGPLPKATEAYLSELGAQGRLDMLALDATFNGTNWMPTSHHSVDEAIALIEHLSAKRGYLTHLTMHYGEPITRAELEAKLEPWGGRIAIAYDGLRIAI